ncbi:helix-turn-helix domain-containing protein [Candidatus Lariskella endosymbiont of Hedychridium roseum]|uniref:helix-turn-helix domain-containing protein n=1 Tax=Candidatus Lariskella endosymbiont of Hedychridium roseum TaxID=3077949 RepID=UPI0030CBF4E3
MPSSYSEDFRKKVITYVERGNSCESAAIKFEIASNTVRNWYKRYNAEGSYSSRKVGGKKGRINVEEVAIYVNSKADFILSEMGAHFGMGASGALYWLRKLGYSYKKNLHVCGSK